MKIICVVLSLFIIFAIGYSANDGYHCQPSDRTNKICPLYVMEMCAWYYPEVCQGTVTIGGTCARSGTNSCVDCQDPKVERVTMGKCPV